MLLAPLLQDRWLVQVLLQVFLLNSVLVTLWANPESHAIRRPMLAVWIVALVGAWLALAPVARVAASGANRRDRIDDAAAGPVAVGILQFVFRGKTLTTDGLFATVAAYLVLALFFAQLYLLLLEWNHTSFNLDVAGHPPQLLQSTLLYFSLVTLATVGYGDILPVSETARTLAVIEATVGQFYVAVIVAVFVGMYSAQRRAR